MSEVTDIINIMSEIRHEFLRQKKNAEEESN
jgi:hypothetical protein